MSKKTVLEEALADAKQLRAMAIETARLSLHESVTPEIEKLLSQKLTEDLSEEVEEEEEESAGPIKSEKAQKRDEEEGKKGSKAMDEISKLGLDETTLAAIQKALEEADEEDESAELDKKKDTEKAEEDEDEESEEEPTEEDEAFDLETALAEIEAKSTEEEGDEEMDESLDIDAILAEMDSDEEATEEADEEEEGDEIINEEYGDDTYEAGKTAESGKVQKTQDTKGWTKNTLVLMRDILDDKIAHYEAGKGAEKGKEVSGKAKTPLATGTKVLAQTQLQEAQIAQLRNELKDLNLLTAKNLYLNKVLVLPNLNESSKAKAITAFDKVKTVSEAKAVFEVLTTALKSTPKANKTTIAESLGFRKTGQSIQEGKTEKVDYLPVANEWQKRAGIKLN